MSAENERRERCADVNWEAIARQRERELKREGDFRNAAESENTRLRAELEEVTEWAAQSDAEKMNHRATIARVRALHVENEGATASAGSECGYCFESWPCGTVEIINGEAEEGAVMGNLGEYLTGDPAYDRAFRALSGCPAYPALESALVRYAAEVAATERQKIAKEITDTFSDYSAETIASFIRGGWTF